MQMDLILNALFSPSNQTLITTCLILAGFRVYLEVIKFDFNSLPLSKAWARMKGEENVRQFHRLGLYLSVGYILLFAPSLIFGH